ncbi:hypothetical protein BST81_22320 [Leptolyngbya sp. 'hensonii']|uniref:lipid-A-disaccharide synthase-related protein n=1 Tax=Leptolyngbya sp. 'hensonii' TaxID=1922337 RepID=UPI0009503172|nr:lipid-A-disaccharide synthase-related protein [Leptolyngbya sp. 'hensonii']OLP16142.1 hypothetical protein BST81_22320 [Leptolyngbya sp. 'hensonii']
MKLLCLSNGHGEDIIAVRILQELQQLAPTVEISALPIVGEGRAYCQIDIPLAGETKTMPSGGFIYMDNQQLVRDIQGGLVGLTLSQIRVVRQWGQSGGQILAVGDIVPLLFGWLSGAPYAFVGTAKSEYYVRDEVGFLPHRPLGDRLARSLGSIYWPWERWMMTHPRCKAVIPRDRITAQCLKHWQIPVFDLGNPMMDGLEPGGSYHVPTQVEDSSQGQSPFSLLLLPGSRPPEAYANWELILQGMPNLMATFRNLPLQFLGAIAPGLDPDPLVKTLLNQGWKSSSTPLLAADPTALCFTQKNATLVLTQQAYNDCLHQADLAIAMAGTATEQFVGLGKPALIIPGQGPQFTPAFAEAQTRLLGPSVILVEQPTQIARAIQLLLENPDRLQLIAENGPRRMGKPGAAHRIAACLLENLLRSM